MTPTTTLSAASARRRYLALIGLRWLPTGLLIPITALLAISRGLSLTEIGFIFSIQGLVVLGLELPTGGLSDALGRRPVLLLASVVGLVSLGLLIVADSVVWFAAAAALQGVYRALDSGPLESWYVDAALAADPDTGIEKGLSAGGSISSLAIAIGALASGALVAVHPIESMSALVLPMVVALGLGLVNLAAIALLMSEVRVARGLGAAADSVRAVPGVVRDGVGLLRGSRVLLALVAVEAFWGFSMVTFESLFPIRLSETLGSTDQAAAAMGPVASAAWFAAAIGAAGIMLVSARIGVARSAALLRVVQGATIVAMGLIAGPIGIVTAYLACYVAHGASNPMHSTLLHREVDGSHRTTVISINSMIGQPAGAIGAIVLASLADATSIPTAMVLGGIVCAIAAPLYIPAWRRERSRGRVAAGAAAAVASAGPAEPDVSGMPALPAA
jgi:MFS family permease